MRILLLIVCRIRLKTFILNRLMIIKINVLIDIFVHLIINFYENNQCAEEDTYIQS